MAELRTLHKVVLRELNHLCVLADLTKGDDRLDNVAKRMLVIMLMLHPLLVAFVEFFGRSCAGQTSVSKSAKFKLY